MGHKGTIMQLNTAAKWGIGIAAGVGLVAGAGLLLAACGREEDPQSKVLDDFQKFDKNRDTNWTQDELSNFEVGRPYSTGRRSTYRVGNMQFYEQQIVHRETTSNMTKAFQAAKGNDAVASLAELVALASRFDKDGNGTLSGGERRDFDKSYGPVSNSRTILDRVETGWYYVDDYPSGGGGGSTSPGDDYGNGGGGSTSPGDDYGGGYNPGGGGSTSPGDSGGGSTSPGDSGGSSGGSSGSGNSTDNGNPSEDDF
jgi:hypothetical protein